MGFVFSRWDCRWSDLLEEEPVHLAKLRTGRFSSGLKGIGSSSALLLKRLLELWNGSS